MGYIDSVVGRIIGFMRGSSHGAKNREKGYHLLRDKHEKNGQIKIMNYTEIRYQTFLGGGGTCLRM